MKVAVAQLHPARLDVEANIARTTRAVADAAARGASLVVLPELVATGYVLDADALRAVAEPGDGSGPVLSAWREAARRHGTAIVGGFAERSGEDLYNAVAVVDRGGELLGCYRKLHLFGAESGVFSAGDAGLPVFELDGVKVGVLVCYDLRFPEAMRLLALRGAELVAAPAAWVAGFDAAGPEPERIGQVEGALVQANLNQVFVACGDQCGETDGVRFLGRSLIASPYGEPIAGPLSPGEEELVVADVEVALAHEARDRGTGISPRRDRRTDVYSLALVDEEVDPDELLAEIERRRGYVLDIHRTLARLDPRFLVSYDAFLEATFLQQRLLDRRTKELIYVGVLIALDTPESHLITHMHAAVKYGATEREVLEVVEQVLSPAGVPRFISALAAFEKAFPNITEDTLA